MSDVQSRSIAELRTLVEAPEVPVDLLAALETDPRAGVRALVARYHRRQARNAKARARAEALMEFEKVLWARGVSYIAGVDEAGAGPLAGPVVAAACILPAGLCLEGVDDSKRLSHRRRVACAAEIKEVAVSYAIGQCSPEEIDHLNIYQASREAMRRAVAGLEPRAEHLLVDARVVPQVRVPQQALVKGDSRSQSIAAASILAKVHRDDLMEDLAREHPGYGFEVHRGYPTAAHLGALEQLGPSPVHRMSFGPVRACRASLA